MDNMATRSQRPMSKDLPVAVPMITGWSSVPASRLLLTQETSSACTTESKELSALYRQKIVPPKSTTGEIIQDKTTQMEG